MCTDDGAIEVFDLEKKEIRDRYILTYVNHPEIRATSDGKGLFLMYSWVTVAVIDLIKKEIVARIETEKECVSSFSFVNNHPFVLFYDILGVELFDMRKMETVWYRKYADDEITTFVNTRQTEIEFDIEPWVQEIWNWADEHSIPKELLPRNQYDLLKIEALNLEDGLEYEIASIPKEIGYLSNLTRLSFMVESKSGIPEEIGLLENLESLSIRVYAEDETIVALPKSVENLTGLHSLFFWGNISGSSIERLLSNNIDINTLYIRYNNTIECIPKSICPSKSLKTLMLQNTDNLILPREQVDWAYQLKGKKQPSLLLCDAVDVDGSPMEYKVELSAYFRYISWIPR